MAFNGSGAASGGGTGGGGGSGGGGGDGPLNKRLCTGKENNEAGLNNNRVSKTRFSLFIEMLLGQTHDRHKHKHTYEYMLTSKDNILSFLRD